MASCQFLKHFSSQFVFANVWPGSAQAPSQEGCRHSLSPSFAAGYWSHVYSLSVIFSVPPTHLIPPPFPSPPVPALWLQIPFCIHAIQASPATLSYTFPFSLSLPTCPRALSHLLSLPGGLSFSYPTSSTPQQAGGAEDQGEWEDRMGMPPQQGDTLVRQKMEKRKQSD